MQVFNPSDSFGITDFSQINLSGRKIRVLQNKIIEMISRGTLDRDVNVAQ